MENIFKTNTRLSTTSKNNITSAFWGAIFGFFLFFLIIIIAKAMSYSLGIINQFQIEAEDILLSVIGLVLMSLIKILEELRLKEPLS